MAFPMGFHGGTSAWRPMMMRRRAQPGCASESRQGAEAWSILIGEKVACYQGKMRILQMKLMILGNFDDFAREHYWILMRKMKKNDDFTREHDNLIMDHGDLTRKCGKNCDVGILPGET